MQQFGAEQRIPPDAASAIPNVCGRGLYEDAEYTNYSGMKNNKNLLEPRMLLFCKRFSLLISVTILKRSGN